MTELGLTKSERRYYEIGYDAGFKQSREETIREVEGKIESEFIAQDGECEHGFLPATECPNSNCEGRLRMEIKQILNSMKE